MLMNSLFHRIVLTLLISISFVFGQAVAHGTDQDLVRHAMMAVFGKPTDPLNVEPVVVSGDYAVAGWVQSGKGGRAVLQKMHGHWSIMVCGGDGLKDAKALEQTGMSAATAATLAKSLAAAESKVSADTRKKFAMFDGILKVDAGHSNPHPGKPAIKHP